MQELQSTPHLDYLQQLRTSGLLTQGELLELEDHCYTTYENLVEFGESESVASQNTALSMGKPEQIIESYQQSFWQRWLLDRGAFFSFGLVIQLLCIWPFVILINAATNLFFIKTLGSEMASVLQWPIGISTILLTTLLYWRINKNRSSIQDAISNIAQRVNSIAVSVFLSLPIVLLSALSLWMRISLLGDTYWEILFSESFEAIMEMWVFFFLVSNLFLSVFHFWRGKYTHLKRAWSYRLSLFHIAGWLSFSMILLAEQFVFGWIFSHLVGFVVVLAALAFPYFFKYIWKQQKYLSS